MIDLTGKVIGNVTVIRRVGRSSSGMHTYLYKCRCGNESIATGSSIKRSINGCKNCAHKSTGVKNRIGKGKAGTRMVFNNYKLRAKRDNLIFQLTFDEFENLILKNCHYCGSEPSSAWKTNEWAKILHNGIDRKHSDTGYVLNNCLSCCKTCNFGKNDLSYEDWNTYLDRLTYFRKTREVT